MHARFWFWWSAIFGPLALIWAAWMATGMHWLVAGLSGGAAALHGGAARWQYKHLPPRISPPTRHDLCLADIDRLERELRMGSHAKTEVEFDRQVFEVVHPFQYRLGRVCGLLLGLYLTRRGLRGMHSFGTGRRGQLSAVQSIGQVYGQTLRRMMGDDWKD